MSKDGGKQPVFHSVPLTQGSSPSGEDNEGDSGFNENRLLEMAGSTRYAENVRNERREEPRLVPAHAGEGTLVRPIGFTKGARRRFLVVWVRWLRGPWLLWTLSLFLAFCLAVSASLVAGLALLGLLAAWEAAGRIASSYHEIHDERLRRNGVRRAFAFVAALAASLAYFTTTIRLVGTSYSDDSTLTPVLILAATVVGIWLVFRIARQGWRTGYAALGLVLVSVVGVYAVVDDVSTPDAATMGISLLRLISVWVIAAGFMLASTPEHRAERWRRAVWLLPLQALSLAYVLRPPGELNESWDVGLWWIAIGVFGALAAAILGLGVLGLREDAELVWRLYRFESAPNRRYPDSTIFAVLFLPAVAMAPLSGWVQWSLTTALSTLAAATVFGLLRRTKPSIASRSSAAVKEPQDKASPAGEQEGPPKVLTLSAV